MAVFALPDERGKTCPNQAKRKTEEAEEEEAVAGRQARRSGCLTHGSRRGVDLAESGQPRRRSRCYGEEAEEEAEEAKASARRCACPRRSRSPGTRPVELLPDGGGGDQGRAHKQNLVWVSAKGLGVGPNTQNRPTEPVDPTRATKDDKDQDDFQYLPEPDLRQLRNPRVPRRREAEQASPRRLPPDPPLEREKAPAGTPAAPTGPAPRSSTSSTSCARTAPTTRCWATTRAATATRAHHLRRRSRPTSTRSPSRFPLLDHVYANSEASIDGHFWTRPRQGLRLRPQELEPELRAAASGRTTSASTRSPGRRRASCSTRPSARASPGSTSARRSPASPLVSRQGPHRRGPRGRRPSSTTPTSGRRLRAAASRRRVLHQRRLHRQERISARRSPTPRRRRARPPTTEVALRLLRAKFNHQVAEGNVPTFNYITFPKTTPRARRRAVRTPRALVADNDYALGQCRPDLAFPVWEKSPSS